MLRRSEPHKVAESRRGSVRRLYSQYSIATEVNYSRILRRETGAPFRGYTLQSGPVASHKRIPESVIRNFQAALRKALLERRVIAVFSRLHPLIPQQDLLSGLGECRTSGQTISVDLTQSLQKQREQ